MGVDVDYKSAFKHAKLAADAEFAEGYRLLAECYQGGSGVEQNLKKAFENYSLGAKAGDDECKFYVAQFLLQGIGTPKDQAKGSKAMVLLAAIGYPRAEFELGKAYMEGSWVGKNEEQARVWLERARRNGNSDAERLLKSLEE